MDATCSRASNCHFASDNFVCRNAPIRCSRTTSSTFRCCLWLNKRVTIGALTGLIAGLMYDFVLPTPVGLTSLALGLAGATAGLLVYFYREPTWWMRLITIGVVSLLGEVYYPLAQTVVGLDGWLQFRIIKVAIVVAVCNLVLSPIAIFVCRWTLTERKLSV
jgi:rod shape-determining protein MreD